ncbi:MAG: glycine cleavage system aminomethyltransferase GcvT [Bacteroidales bacterium]|jgi:aminomethyltransferase|nr:glycine cleavage system aminomethyltransferase GcvT [Bacteroidales bacterium]
MKNTAFTKFHEKLGAKMVPFVGFNMPIEYSGITDEHLTVRKKIGVFDVSHMGEFWVEGPKAFGFVQKITSNNVADLFDGKVQYSCMPNGKSGIVDDLLVYQYNREKYLLVVNAANIEKDWNWVVKNAVEYGIDVEKYLRNASDETAQLAIQGPLALKAMQKLTSLKLEDMENYTFKEIEFAGIKNVLFSTTGYTGSGGCEIYVNNKDAEKLWNLVFEAGEEFGIKPIGLGARDTLRLEAGLNLYGNDMNDETSSIEAGLGWITKFVDGNDFINRTEWQKQKEEGVAQRLKGFVLQERGIPRQHYKVVDAEGNEIGEVTSGTMSPIINKGIGMAYVKKGFWKQGSEIFIQIRKKNVKAIITRPPFHIEK